jgi:hypothetical protein
MNNDQRRGIEASFFEKNNARRCVAHIEEQTKEDGVEHLSRNSLIFLIGYINSLAKELLKTWR